MTTVQMKSACKYYALPQTTFNFKEYLVETGQIPDPADNQEIDGKEIVELLKSDYKISEIARKFGCDQFAVWRYCKSEGLAKDDFELFKNNTLKFHIPKKRVVSPKPVDRFSLDGTYIKTYPSCKAAAHDCGKIGHSHIPEVCQGKRKSAYGSIWRWHDEATL